MNTTQLKKFAAEARTILKEGVINRLDALGFDGKGNVSEEDRPTKGQGFVLFRGEAMPDDGFFERWQSLYDRVQQKGIQEVYEEAAYTWFNRLMAIRIMAKNGFIAPVLEYVSESTRIPVILSQAREGQYPEMSAAEREQLMAIIDDGRKSQEQFAILITAYCHANPIINKCFGGVTDYTTLLLPQNIIAQGGFIDLLNNTPFIEDEDYKSAELIGWLYQFYISEKKDDVFASFKAGKKAKAEDIPAATQIFTPNWIVKYMVQNTLGRIYLDNNPFDTEMKEKMQYLVEPSEPTPEEAKFKYESLEDLRLGDLACGSGHILNEFFDLMYLFYIEDGYSRRNAIENIFLKNLTGIDLDTRAKQLAQFALLVKACQKDPSFLDAAVMPNVLDMPAPLDMNFVKQTLPEFFLGVNMKVLQETEDAFELLQQAENLGSIMKFNISESTRAAIEIRMKEWEAQPAETVSDGIKALLHSFRLILALTQKYSALVMNPPYMGAGNMNPELLSYVKDNYEDGKADLCTAFMLMQSEKASRGGYYANIIPPSWMFLSTFENLRIRIIESQKIDTLLYLSRGIFGADFGSVSCTIRNCSINNATGDFFKLIKRTFQEFKQEHLKELFEEVLKNKDFKYDFSVYTKDIEEIKYCESGSKIYYPNVKQREFLNIPGNPLGFWASESFIDIMKGDNLSTIAHPRRTIQCGDVNKYIKFWSEVSFKDIELSTEIPILKKSSRTWFKFSSGGQLRRWYGNLDSVLYWSHNGDEIKNSGKAIIPNEDLYFKECVGYNRITSNGIASRYFPQGILLGDATSILVPQDNIKYFVGLLNSKIANYSMSVINPSLAAQTGSLSKIPVVFKNLKVVTEIIDSSIEISKVDWDAHETSWDFQRNELLCMDEKVMLDNIDWKCEQEYKATGTRLCIDPAAPEPDSIKWCYETYVEKWGRLHTQLRQNEIELNEKFIEIYGLQEELDPFVPVNEITILQQGEVTYLPTPGGSDYFIRWNADEVMKQFLSYAIGCWMGRYRLDKPGLWIAHPNPKPEEIAKYEYNGQLFEIDDDGIIPLLPAYASFADNGYQRIIDFVRIAFGTEKLTENLNFIEESLGTSIEKFMVKDFWKYHKKMYQNRPIYWLFSSKKGAFQCLTYMHRMNAYTVEQIRSKYLLPHIEWLKNHIAEMEGRASQLSTQERKQKEQMAKDLKECLEYHDELHVVADHQITFDLDDGVVKNYAKFGNVLAKLK